MDHLSRLVHPIRRRDKLETDQIDRVPGRRQSRRHHDQRATIRLSRCIRPTTSLRLLPRSSPWRLPSHLKRKTARSCHHVLRPIHPPRQERFRKSKPGNGSIRENNHHQSHNPGHRRSTNHGQERSRKADRYGWRQDCWNDHAWRPNEDHEGKTRTGNVGPKPLLTRHELRNPPEQPIETVRQLTDRVYLLTRASGRSLSSRTFSAPAISCLSHFFTHSARSPRRACSSIPFFVSEYSTLGGVSG